MRYTYTGKNMSVSEKLKERTEQKLSKLGRLLPEDAEVFVAFSSIKTDNKIEVTIPLHKRVLRAEVTTGDMYQSIDEIIDILEKQMVKFKTRLKHKSRRDGAFRDEFILLSQPSDEETNDSHEIVIEKNKHFELRPMDAEEAVMEMELLGHTFFVFRNAHTETVNVVYKRRNGTYGIIEPGF